MRWQRLLRSIKNISDGDAAAGNSVHLAGASQFVFDAGLLSDVGCTRTNNEDAGRIVRGSNSDPNNRMLVVVADGMGGHNAGEIASATAISVVAGAYAQMRNDPAEQLKEALETASATIHQKSIHDSAMQGMGTTCTALLLQEGRAYSAHVGDSRIYLIRNDSIYLMTEDHSAVMELVKRGELTLKEARHHPDKNVVTRCLGTRPQVEVSVWPEPLLLQPGDQFLLCSDGLYDQVDDDEICGIVRPRGAVGACEELIRVVKERGAPDNVTVAVIGLQGAVPPQDACRVTRQIEVHP